MKNHIQRKKLQHTHLLRRCFHSLCGQILLEALWLILFSCAFLAMLSHLYEKGNKEIQLSRIGYKNFHTKK